MTNESQHNQIFTGNIYLFYSFDIGDDINLEKLRRSGTIIPKPLALSRFFKHYHIPLAFELPGQLQGSYISARMHNFGAVSFIYKVPFKDTLQNIRKNLEDIDNRYAKIAVEDAKVVYKRVRSYISKPNFYQTQSTYVMIQVDPQPELLDTVKLKETYGGIIASTLRFETENLSEYQKNEILLGSMGYYRGDLIVIDTEAAFVYDDEYDDILQFIEFANIQNLELRYFDRILDEKLFYIYEDRTSKVPLKSYLPFIGTLKKGPVDELSKLRVDISVIIERLASSIMLAGDPYYSELYALLAEKLELKTLKDAIDTKLGIVGDILSILQNKIDAIREDMLNVSIVILIVLELIVLIW